MSLRTGGLLGLWMLAAACAHPPVSASPPRLARPAASVPAPAPAPAPAASPTIPPADAEWRQRIDLPGCTPERLQRVQARIDEITRRVRPPRARIETLERDVKAIWDDPCVRHVTLDVPAPRLDPEQLAKLWLADLASTLAFSAGALHRRGQHLFLAVPAEPPAPLSRKEQRALAHWLCADGDSVCGRAESFIARAEREFDRDESASPLFEPMRMATPLVQAPCAPRPREPGDKSSETPFEGVIRCASAFAPHTWRYPRSVRWRAVDRGWLVLRGRRGHYSFADEIRAYDLATGAAYVARSASGLVLAGPNVDFDAVDARRTTEAFAGTVDAAQVRELAFVLGTARAARARRSQEFYLQLDPHWPIAFSKGVGLAKRELAERLFLGRTSEETTLDFAIVDGSVALAKGSFKWPESARAVDAHAVGLTRVLEAGLVRGCAPAALPTRLVRGPHGPASALDADAGAQDRVYAELARRLEELGQSAGCA